jgi:hypothetical protein
MKSEFSGLDHETSFVSESQSIKWFFPING